MRGKNKEGSDAKSHLRRFRANVFRLIGALLVAAFGVEWARVLPAGQEGAAVACSGAPTPTTTN
jgi:hypothetical protein